MKRRSSWKDTLKAFASGTEESIKQRSRRSSLSKDLPTALGVADEGTLADAESEDEDFGQVKEEDRPIEARVRYKYPDGCKDLLRSTSVLEKKQYELLMAVAEADNKAMKAVAGKSTAEPIGTRLTMTSRTGYFQDRIISASMVSVLHPAFVCRPTDELDACNGDPLYWSTPQSGFCYGLSYFSYPNAKSFTCAVSSFADAVRRERPVCG